LFSQLDVEFGGFDLDAAADKDSALCARYYTEEKDALKQDWVKDATIAFCNPPYGRMIGKFVAKAYTETLRTELTVVLLIPARTDTKWWHAYCAHGEVRFIKGRLKFENPALPSWRADGNFKLSPAPFPSAIVVLGAKAKAGTTTYVTYKDVAKPLSPLSSSPLA
jgi:site-specific DNA-methyltransferase (adenine-specific)